MVDERLADQRHPEIGNLGGKSAHEIARGDADDGEGHAVQHDRAAQDWGAREAALPVVLADEELWVDRQILSVARQEDTAADRRHSQHREEIFRHLGGG